MRRRTLAKKGPKCQFCWTPANSLIHTKKDKWPGDPEERTSIPTCWRCAALINGLTGGLTEASTWYEPVTAEDIEAATDEAEAIIRSARKAPE